MSTKLRGLLVLCGMLLGGILFAQEKTVTGAVTDPYGFGVPDASVKSSSGEEVFTDADGNYSISANEGDVLTIEASGLDVSTVTVGTSNVYNATLRESGAIELEGAVVTALGITREKKSLGYATQEVGGETLSAVPVSNFADALSGEVAGLDIKSSGSMGGSSNMIIRGFSSLVGSNQALIVVDGTPINDKTFNTTGQESGRAGFDYGNAATDLNPNDIENINVLKGAAASALYGSRGMNGVIMITTKKGKRKKGIGVEVNSSFTVGSVDNETLPKYQKRYGQGYSEDDGSYATNGFFDENQYNFGMGTQLGADASFGAEFDPNLMIYQWNSIYPDLSTFNQATPWVAAKNDPNFVWKNSTTYVNSASFSGGNEKGSFRAGFTNYLHEGSLENATLKRNTVDFGGDYLLSEDLKVSAKFTYTNNKGLGRVGTGYDSWNPMQAFRQWWGVNVDMVDQRNAYFQTRKNLTWNANWKGSNYAPAYSDNYYWVRYENFQNDSRDRYTGNIALDYQINDWLSVMGRFTLDNYTETREERIAVGSAGDFSTGRYKIFDAAVSENNYDVMLNIDKDLTENINLNANLGWNLRVNKEVWFQGITNGGLKIPGIYALNNSVNPLTSDDIDQYDATIKTDGLYARASLGFYNTFFIDGSFRADRSSSLPVADNRYYYPSVSGSFLFSELIDQDWLSFGKLRGGWAKVGNATGAYQLYNTYVMGASFGSIGSASNPATFNNENLKSETMEEMEFGIEMGFLKNRVNFDVTYYDRTTTDLITRVSNSSSTGSLSSWQNAGTLSNKGIEARLSLTPIRSNNFTWNITANWAKNDSEVEELAEGIDYLELASLQGGLSIGGQRGEAYGVIRGSNFVYNNGNKVVIDDPNDPYYGQYAIAEDIEVIGNMNPEWTAGIRNTVTYKNLSLSFLIDIQKGGDVFSLDTWYGYATGLYDITAGLNDLGNPIRNTIANGGGVILNGVKSDGTPNDIRVEAFDGYNNPWGYNVGGGRSPNAAHVYDASYVKLRNVTLSYSLPESLINNTFMTKFTISAIGRNLWIIDKKVPYSDPEAGLSAGNVQGYQSGAHPTFREIGASVKIEF